LKNNKLKNIEHQIIAKLMEENDYCSIDTIENSSSFGKNSCVVHHEFIYIKNNSDNNKIKNVFVDEEKNDFYIQKNIHEYNSNVNIKFVF
jgi:hypothetical protein